MSKLIIVGHPDLSESVINKRWVEELKKYPDQFTVHNISEVYPDEKIDIKKEQSLIEKHEILILQYPFYWVSCPAILKKWLEKVFTYGWAFGPDGHELKGKKVAFAISTGGKENAYQPDGRYKATIDQLILPMKTTALYTQMDYKGYFVLHDSHNMTPDRLEQSAQDYIKFISNLE